MQSRVATRLAIAQSGLPFPADGREPGDANCEKSADLASPDFGPSLQLTEIEWLMDHESEIETPAVHASSRA